MMSISGASFASRVTHKLLIVLLAVFFTGCKLHIVTPEHASITTTSGNYYCAAGDTCTIEIDSYFDEVFVAEAEPGYYFHSWKKKQNHLCGSETGQCSVSLTAQTEHVLIRESDNVGYLEPDIRPISPGWSSFAEGLEGVVDEGLKACLRNHSERMKVRYVEAVRSLFCGGSQNDGYQIISLEGLGQFYNIERLGFVDANLADLSPMDGLVNLKYFLTQLSFLEDLRSLTKFENLEELKLYGGVGSLAGIAEMTSLKYLLVWSYGGSTTPLVGLPNLEIARFEYAQSIDLNDFSTLPKIRHLNIGSNNLQNISGMENMSRSLKSFTVLGAYSFTYRGPVTDLSPISGLTWLKRLSIRHTSVSDISSLERLTSLTSLTLSDNDINSVYPLAGLTSLKKLDLRNNNFGDISPFEYMDELVDVNLSGNKIKLIRTGLRGVSEGVVRLDDNPLSCLDLEYYQLEKPSAVQVFSNVFCAN